MDPRGGGGTSSDIVPTQIKFGVDVSTRCWGIAQKPPKCKIPHCSHSNENFISPFFRPPKGEETHSEPEYTRMQNLAWISPRVVEKSLTEQTNKKTYSKTNTSPFTLTSEWRVINRMQTSMDWASHRSCVALESEGLCVAAVSLRDDDLARGPSSSWLQTVIQNWIRHGRTDRQTDRQIQYTAHNMITWAFWPEYISSITWDEVAGAPWWTRTINKLVNDIYRPNNKNNKYQTCFIKYIFYVSAVLLHHAFETTWYLHYFHLTRKRTEQTAAFLLKQSLTKEINM